MLRSEGTKQKKRARCFSFFVCAGTPERDVHVSHNSKRGAQGGIDDGDELFEVRGGQGGRGSPTLSEQAADHDLRKFENLFLFLRPFGHHLTLVGQTLASEVVHT